jgi:hypothetical protein
VAFGEGEVLAEVEVDVEELVRGECPTPELPNT